MNPSLPDKKVVLVTGATGNVGKEVLMQLAKMTDRYEIRAFDLKTKRSVKGGLAVYQLVGGVMAYQGFDG